MDFLRRLFGGGSGGRGGKIDRDGMYFYIRGRRSGEIVRLRLDFNQLTPDYDEGGRVSGYFVYKTVVGARSFERMEAEFAFDPNKRLINKTVTGGEFVGADDWEAQQASTTQS